MEKYCSGCKSTKLIKDFYLNKSTKDKRDNICKLCRKVSNHKSVPRIKAAKYGITLTKLNELNNEQCNKCKICESIFPLCIDHCHKSGKVRGLLCNSCNLMIGYAKDNIKILQKAIDYLTKVK